MSKDEPVSHAVLLSAAARKDLRDIVRWIAANDSPHAAHHVLDEIERTYRGLTMLPDRGAYPPELLALGVRRYRQVHFKPYRIIYRVVPDAKPPCVLVMLIADSRRDLTSLLSRRLLAP